MRVFASHNPDNHIRATSSAGGVFTSLAERILAEGGAVYGVAFGPNWTIENRRASTPDELSSLRGSKYAFVPIGPVIGQIENDLKDGKPVIVSSTPCQIAAVRQRFGDHPSLLLVEVICHSAPEHKYWDMFLDELCHKNKSTRDDITSVTFRDKRNGWKRYTMVINFNNGREYSKPLDKNPYMRAFLKGYTVREACFRCPFKYPEGSRADISLCDFWGIEKITPEIDNNTGTTAVIARTEKGIRATVALPADADLTLEQVARYNRGVTKSARRPEKYSEFRSELSQENKIIGIMKRYAGRTLRQRIRYAFKRASRRKIFRIFFHFGKKA